MQAIQHSPETSAHDYKPIAFAYQGKDINFKQQHGAVMINATQMAKVFGKTPKDWIRLQSTKEFLKALNDSRKADMPNGMLFSIENDGNLINVIRGGKQQGTWMQEDVALEFSRWLSPHFAIWTNRHIKDLLLNGRTALNEKEKGFPKLPPKRNHNRLTQARLVDILVDVARVDNKELRLSLMQKLGL